MCSMVQGRLGLGLPFSGKVLPMAPRLLYLLSSCLTQELPYWPSSVQVWPACPKMWVESRHGMKRTSLQMKLVEDVACDKDSTGS